MDECDPKFVYIENIPKNNSICSLNYKPNHNNLFYKFEYIKN